MNQLPNSLPVNSNQTSKMKDTNETYLTSERKEKRGNFQTSLATPEIVKEEYQAVKLHFSSKSYNYNKYQGKVKNCSQFKDIIPYAMIARDKRQTDFPTFFLPGIFQNPRMRIEQFLTADYISVWRYWLAYQNAPSYLFEQELNAIQNYLKLKNISFDELFTVSDNELPKIYKFLVRQEVSPQTIVYLNQVLNFYQINSSIQEKILFPKLEHRLKKLETFIRFKSKENLKKIVQKVFCS